MTRSRIWVWTCALAVVPACAKRGPEPQAHAPVVHQSEAAGERPQTAYTPTPPPEGRLSEEALAYLSDCGHRFQTETEFGDEIDECLNIGFDQNCAPDPSGCWEQGQACRSACGPSCASCDDECAGSCQGCVDQCAAGDDECWYACAEERVGCRDTCIDARDACDRSDCNEEETRCYAEHEAKVAKQCPNCAKLVDCAMAEYMEADDPARPKGCDRLMEKASDECLQWCGPEY